MPVKLSQIKKTTEQKGYESPFDEPLSFDNKATKQQGTPIKKTTEQKVYASPFDEPLNLDDLKKKVGGKEFVPPSEPPEKVGKIPVETYTKDPFSPLQYIKSKAEEKDVPELTDEQKLQKKGQQIQQRYASLENIPNILNQNIGTKFNAVENLSDPDKTLGLLNAIKDHEAKTRTEELKMPVVQEVQPYKQPAYDPSAPPSGMFSDFSMKKGQYKMELTDHFVDLTIADGKKNNLTHNQIVTNVFKGLDKQGHDNYLKIIQDRTGEKTDENFWTGASEEGAIIKSTKAPFSVLVNDRIQNTANEMMTVGTLTGDQVLIENAKSYQAQVKTEQELMNEHPILVKSKLAASIANEIATELGTLKDTESTGFYGFLGKVNLGLPKRVQIYETKAFKDAYADPAQRDKAIDLLMFPDQVAESSLFGSVPVNFWKPIKDFFHSGENLIGVRDKMDRQADVIKEGLFPEELPDIKDYMQTSRIVTNTSAVLAGYSALGAVGGELGAAAGLTGRGVRLAHSAFSFGIGAYDGNMKEADNMDIPDAAKVAYSTIGMVINTAGGELLGLPMLSKMPVLQKPIIELANKIADKTISKELVNELIESKIKPAFIDYAKTYGLGVGKNVIAMKSFEIGNAINKSLFDDNTTNADVIKAATTGFVDAALGVSLLSLMGLKAKTKAGSSGTLKSALYRLASNPEEAKDVVTLALHEGKYTQAEYDQKIQILNTAITAKKSLDIIQSLSGKQLEVPQKTMYVANLTAEAVAKKQLENTKLSDVDRESYTEQLKFLQSQNVEILNGLKFDKNFEPLTDLYETETNFLKARERFNDGTGSEAELLKAKKLFIAEQRRELVPLTGLDKNRKPLPSVEKGLINIEDAIITDFDDTIADPATNKLLPFGEEIKQRIANGENITIATHSSDKQGEPAGTNKKRILSALGLTEQPNNLKIEEGKTAAEKAEIAKDQDGILIDNNPENIEVAKGEGAKVVDANELNITDVAAEKPVIEKPAKTLRPIPLEKQDVVPAFEKVKEKVGEEKLVKVQEVISRVNKNENINEREIFTAQEELLNALDVAPEAAHLIEPLFNKLEDYEFTTKTETRTVTKEIPVEGTGEPVEPKPKRTVSKSIEQWEGSRATVTGQDGKQNAGVIKVDEAGDYGLFNEAGEKMAALGNKDILNRDISLPSVEDVPRPIELDDNGNVKSITLQLNKVDMERGGLQKGDLIKIEFTDQEKALDYAIQLRAEQVGEVPDAVFQQAYKTVEEQVSTEVPKYTPEQLAAKAEERILPPEYARNVNALITPATIRSFDKTTARMQGLTIKYNDLMQEMNQNPTDAKLLKIRELERAILNEAKAEIIDSIAGIRGVEVMFKDNNMGSWQGNFEPSMNMSLKITADADTKALSDFVHEFGEKYSQDAIYLETNSEFHDDAAASKIPEPLSVVKDGFLHYPQLLFTFGKTPSAEQLSKLSNSLKENGVNAFSANIKQLAVSIISDGFGADTLKRRIAAVKDVKERQNFEAIFSGYLKEVEKINASSKSKEDKEKLISAAEDKIPQTDQYKLNKFEYDVNTIATIRSVQYAFGNDAENGRTVRYKKSKYIEGKETGEGGQQRKFDRTDIFKGFTEEVRVAQRQGKEAGLLRDKQIKLQEAGKDLTPDEMKRLDELTQKVQPIVEETFETKERDFKQAKKEVEAIAEKSIEGAEGFVSKFPIKRPSRSAVKTLRWYSGYTERLGDAARVNIIVPDIKAANALFEKINKEQGVATDLRTINDPTELGYPKRLIELKASNGVITEIQIMTPEGYLAKDGVKSFEENKQDFSRQVLDDVRNKLGWDIPDGLGHYFYEINRDLNVPENIRKAAETLSNKYYDAFSNPESKLNETAFKKEITDFKNKVDAEDKATWDRGNEGKSPKTLNDFLGVEDISSQSKTTEDGKEKSGQKADASQKEGQADGTTKTDDVEGAGTGTPPVPPSIKRDGSIAGSPEQVNGITLAANELLRQSIGMPSRIPFPESFEKWDAEAKTLIEKGYDMNALIDKMNSGQAASPVENSIRKVYVATLNEQLKKNPTNDLLLQAKRYAEAEAIANAQAGKDLVSLKKKAEPMDDLMDFYVAKMEANATDILTEKQKKDVQAEFEKVEKAKGDMEAKWKDAEAKNTELLAEVELLKQKKKGKSDKAKIIIKDGKRDFKAERKILIDKLKAAKAEHLKYMKDQGIQQLGFGGGDIVLTNKMVKVIGEIVRNHVEEIGTNLAEVTKRVFNDVKDDFKGITEKDIHDVIAGVHSEKRQTKNEITAKISELRSEAILLNELDRLLRGEPKTENEKIKKNQRLTQLSAEINRIKQEERLGQYSDEGKAKRAIEVNKKATEKLEGKLADKDFEEKKAPQSFIDNPEFKKKFPELYNEALDSYSAKQDALRDYQVGLLKDQQSKMSKGQKTIDFIEKAAGTTKKLVTGVDDSSVFMQTLVSMIVRPVVGAKAFKAHLLDAASRKRFERSLAELHNSPIWDLMQKSGLDITEPFSLSAKQHEEAFAGKSLDITIGGVKILDAALSPFERAFTSLGNNMRAIAFTNIATKFINEGKTFENNPKLFKDLATMLNTETGRGKQNEYLQKASAFVTAGIWSPRLMASRLNILGISDGIAFFTLGKLGTKGYYSQLDPAIQKLALRDLGQFILTSAALTYGAAYAFGGKVDDDPTSQGFMDVSFGDKSYNLAGGFSQYIRLVAQNLRGGKTIDGKFKKFGFAQTAGSNTLHFMRGKLTPITGTVVDVFSGMRDFANQPITIEQEIKRLTVPLSLQGAVSSWDRDGYLSLLKTDLPSFIGMGTKDKRDWEDMKKRSAELKKEEQREEILKRRAGNK